MFGTCIVSLVQLMLGCVAMMLQAIRTRVLILLRSRPFVTVCGGVHSHSVCLCWPPGMRGGSLKDDARKLTELLHTCSMLTCSCLRPMCSHDLELCGPDNKVQRRQHPLSGGSGELNAMPSCLNLHFTSCAWDQGVQHTLDKDHSGGFQSIKCAIEFVSGRLDLDVNRT